MSYKRILTIQDISCVGQCSLTVALPIISACGVETSILPSAVLSTHTAGFTGFTVRDLTDDMPGIQNHWVKEGITFDAIYTGYLGSTRQIEIVADIFKNVGAENCLKIVDPAMADNGNLYPAFDMEYVEGMKKLCGLADFVIPNITEACFLTGLDYRTEYGQSYIDTLLQELIGLGCKNVILTGVSYEAGSTGVVVFENGKQSYYKHPKLPNSCHGTGDIYASAFVGARMRGKDAFTAARIAADFTVNCIEETGKLENHWYGAAFELAIPQLLELLK